MEIHTARHVCTLWGAYSVLPGTAAGARGARVGGCRGSCPRAFTGTHRRTYNARRRRASTGVRRRPLRFVVSSSPAYTQSGVRIRRNLCIREGVRKRTPCVCIYAHPPARVNAPTRVYAPTRPPPRTSTYASIPRRRVRKRTYPRTCTRRCVYAGTRRTSRTRGRGIYFIYAPAVWRARGRRCRPTATDYRGRARARVRRILDTINMPIKERW